jgi:hypothetical protein
MPPLLFCYHAPLLYGGADNVFVKGNGYICMQVSKQYFATKETLNKCHLVPYSNICDRLCK